MKVPLCGREYVEEGTKHGREVRKEVSVHEQEGDDGEKEGEWRRTCCLRNCLLVVGLWSQNERDRTDNE
jgi:hypothetical protein